jgi:alkanesulfonate monooxygenase SsuD/methylene tetrahydromethanopterin reductase-like flavin-dependent oxidoreductase (luciferase family)
MRFGMFDWLDETGRDIGETYEQRLRMLELADRLGFYCYHLAEHHATPLSTTPSPNLFLAAATQRTKRIRLGVLAYLLPFYEPLRLMEEIAMLDQLSGGRIELGLSRGVSPFEMQTYGLKAEESRARFEEAVQVIVAGLTTGKMDFHGTYYDYDNVESGLKPVQRPMPPMWYPTSNVESVPWLASQGLSTVFSVHLALSLDHVTGMLDRYRTELAAHRDGSNRLNGFVTEPNYGVMFHTHVAETDAQAIAQAKESWEHFFANFAFLWLKHGETKRYENRSAFEDLLEKGHLLVGSPATVREKLSQYVALARPNYFVGAFSWGNFTPEQVMTSVELFAREVMPAFGGRP